MTTLLIIFGCVGVFGVLYWYIEIYSVRKHWREAEQWARKYLNN